MGSFIGHVLPGSLFLFVGLWHVMSSVFSFATKPRQFRARVWHPFRLPGPLRYLELILLVLGTFMDILVEFLGGTSFKPFINGELPLGHLNNLEHAVMLLLFFIFATTALISETTSFLPLPEGALHLIASSAFFGEFCLFYFHSVGHGGLEGRYHFLISLLIGACTIIAFLSSAYQNSFLLDLMGATAVTLQGLWFFQIAYSLYGFLLPTGCTQKGDEFLCVSSDYEMRAMGLASIYFCLHIAGVLVFTLIFYGLVVRIWGSTELSDFVSQSEYQAVELEKAGGMGYEMKDLELEDDDYPIPLSLHGANAPNGIFGSK